MSLRLFVVECSRESVSEWYMNPWNEKITANVTQWSHKTFSVEPLCGYSYCTCGHQFYHDYIMKSLNLQQNNLQNYVFCRSTTGIQKLFPLQIIFKCKSDSKSHNDALHVRVLLQHATYRQWKKEFIH